MKIKTETMKAYEKLQRVPGPLGYDLNNLDGQEAYQIYYLLKEWR